MSKCKYFGKCGGCTLQHIDYSVQVANKVERLAQLLDYPIDNIHAITDLEYSYRNRMDFVFHKHGVGFRKRNEWKSIVDIDQCPISDPQLNIFLSEIRSHFRKPDFFDGKRQTGTFKFAVIRIADTSSISFVLNQDSTKLAEAISSVESFAKKTRCENVLITYVDKQTDVSTSSEYFVVKGTDELQVTYFDKVFTFSPQGFFQNNHTMAKKLHAYVTSLLEQSDTKNNHLLDLYGGVGTFGILNAHLFRQVSIVEEFAGCIDAANKNIKLNTISNAVAHVRDAKTVDVLSLSGPLTVITDPPRSGMHKKTISYLNDCGARQLIYVSCNPQVMAKELLLLDRYEVVSVAMCDLFPQTNHMEAVVELRLKK